MHEFHEFSSMFPLLEGEEFDELVADIAANGQHELIVMLDDKILDGRNRYRACKKLGIDPRMRDHNCGDGDPLAYVWSANFNRRHLNTSQRAMAVTERANFLTRGRPRINLPCGGISSEEAAKIAQVSPRSIERAKMVMERGTPNEIASIKNGKDTLYKVSTNIERTRPVGQNGGPGPKIRIPEGFTPESYTLKGIMMEEKTGTEQNAVARELKISDHTYRQMKKIVALAHRNDLPRHEKERVKILLDELNETYQVPDTSSIDYISDRVWGKNYRKNSRVETRRVAEFEKNMEIISHVCSTKLEIPQLNQEQIRRSIDALQESIESLRGFIRKIKETYSG